jgi:hypothetical protein
MVSRRFSAWQKVVALAPLLLLATFAPGQSMLRCRMDGLLRSACCCPPTSDAPDIGPVVKAQDCCQREGAFNEGPAVEFSRSEALDLASATSYTLVSASVPVFMVEPAPSERAWHAHGPPREGPTLVLLKHAFLI